MEDLEFRIGSIDKMDLDCLERTPINPYSAYHKFIVTEENGVYDMYVAEHDTHNGVYDAYDIGHTRDKFQIVGGGSVYIDKNKNLCVGSHSGLYGAIPKKVAEIFGIKLKEKLKGVEINEVIANPTGFINKHWKNVNYQSIKDLT